LREFNSSYIKETSKEIDRLKNKLQEIFDIVGNSGDLQAQAFLNKQFNKIKDINNINSCCEGVVFKYNDNLYKITGLFSPLNQILGMTKYKRGNMEPIKLAVVTNESKTAVLSWGRFNPPTIGHEVVFKCANDLANKQKADFFIIPTKTVDTEKNPLTLEEKICYLNKIFPEYNKNILQNNNINTIFEAAKYFSDRGYDKLKLVVGSDRTERFEMLKNYNGKDYNFKNIEIISAGERLDEGEDASSMSASKMRQAATEGNIDAFMKGFAGRLDLEEGVKLMNLIRSRIEVVDGDKKKFLEPISPSLLAEVIKKSGNKWCVFSKKQTKEGKKKKLGCYNSRTGAKKRLRQVEYFKSIKETMTASSGAVQGAAKEENNPWNQRKVVYLEEDNVEEGSGVGYNNKNSVGGSIASLKGASLKRDDEPSKKDIIKILIMQEEQFMINRAEFIQEIKLRKLVRETLKRKIKEENELILKEEKKLRLVIRRLLNEGEEDTPHPITGINVLKDLLKKIVPTIEKDYKNLTTDQNQRKSFRAHLIKAAKDLLHLSNSPQKAAEVEQDQELQEEIVEDPNIPKDPKFIAIKKPQTIKKEPVDSFSIQGMDTTGRDVSQKTFDKIKKQIETSRSMLSNKKDVSAFEDYLLTNLKLHMDVFDNEMNVSAEEPSTPEYDQEKQKLDSNPPEADKNDAATAGTESPPETTPTTPASPASTTPPEPAQASPVSTTPPAPAAGSPTDTKPPPVTERRNKR
jgi:nicotinic acid mononucleotide adenylyltransferase